MFIEEEIQKLGLLSTLPNQFTITNYSNRIIVIEGTIKLLSLTQSKITLTVSTHLLTIEGGNLTLKNLTNTSLTIIGNQIIIK